LDSKPANREKGDPENTDDGADKRREGNAQGAYQDRARNAEREIGKGLDDAAGDPVVLLICSSQGG
jgi:hypothetical protein